jgi:uncharacterized repeat protein (TIGR01451 family)
VPIDQGATVSSAFIEFSVDGPYEHALELELYGEAAADAQAFDATSSPEDRTITESFAVWSIPASDRWDLGQIRRSPDLSEIVQEIVNREDWMRDNSLAIIVKNDGDSTPYQHRRVIAYERAVSSPDLYPARLIVHGDSIIPEGDLEADLVMNKYNGASSATAGGPAVYTIIAANAGPDPVAVAIVVDSFPDELTCSWICEGDRGASCPAGDGSGDIAEQVDLPEASWVTYTARCSIDGSASGNLANSATITAPDGVTDPNQSNNSDTDVDSLISGLPETLDLYHTRFFGNLPFQAGRTIRVTNCSVEPSSEVTLEAGESVVFRNGFRVESGGILSAGVDPTLLP